MNNTPDEKELIDYTAELASRVKGLVYEYSGKLNIATVIGTLHIIALEVIEEAK